MSLTWTARLTGAATFPGPCVGGPGHALVWGICLRGLNRLLGSSPLSLQPLASPGCIPGRVSSSASLPVAGSAAHPALWTKVTSTFP